MFYKKWDDISIINHIMSKHGKKPFNSSYYSTNYPAVYAAAEFARITDNTSEENRWRKAHDAYMGIGGFMEEDIVNSNTDTIPIPILNVERKTLPVFCPWCNRIAGIAKTDIVRFDKISPAFKEFYKCQGFINEGMVFIRGGNSSLSRWLVSFCRRMRAFSGK